MTGNGHYLALTSDSQRQEAGEEEGEESRVKEAGSDYSDHYQEEEELVRGEEMTEEDVEALFEDVRGMEYSVDHQGDDDEGIEYEEIIIREEPKPKVAGATMSFG